VACLSRCRLTAGLIVFIGALGAATGCSHAPKKTTPELARYQGKKVALVEVDGEPTSRGVVEVALINQLVQRGTFILVSKQDVEAARAAPSIDPTDWQAIARKSGADVALRATVLKFEGVTREGYSSEVVEDSQIAEEQGGDGKTEHVYKVRSITGNVRVELEFTDLRENDTRAAVAEATDVATAESRTEAGHLPPKLRFLEKVSNEAFRKFFDQYN
jgi:hypothetical protein